MQKSVLQRFLFIWLSMFVRSYSLFPGQKKSNSPPFIYMPFFWEGSALPFCPSYPPEHTAMTFPQLREHCAPHPPSPAPASCSVHDLGAAGCSPGISSTASRGHLELPSKNLLLPGRSSVCHFSSVLC